MNSPSLILGILEADEPIAALRFLAEAYPLRAAVWMKASDHSISDAWPPSVSLTQELRAVVVHALQPEIFPLGSQFREDARVFPNAETLLLPLGTPAEDLGTIALIADRGTFGDDVEPWGELGRACHTMAARCARRTAMEAEAADLRQRAEESEALHTLGLAANRTLDPEEVLGLVTRFARTLLGANYVTISTSLDGQIHTVASVGMRAAEAAKTDYLLARRVVEAGQPLTVGGAGADLRVEDFPLHVQEGMEVGLGIPLSLFGETFGALIVGYRRSCEISGRDIRLALTLAGHGAVAISNARLHQEVEEHSRELEKAYERLREMTRVKERFFNAISHDLRTPLTAIRGYNDLLLDGVAGEIPPRAIRYLENTRRAAGTLVELVNDILDFAKLDAGKLQPELGRCDLGELIRDAVAAVEPQAAAKELALEVSAPEGLPALLTDPKRLRQILVNLLSNAVKFTPSGAVVLSVRVGQRGTPEAGVEMRVTDTGPGIAAEDLSRIFLEFEQVEGAVGTGLGLPISRRLAELLGGTLGVESALGQGSTFILRLPESSVIGADVPPEAHCSAA
jgi:signal transduction histidine kinase